MATQSPLALWLADVVTRELGGFTTSAWDVMTATPPFCFQLLLITACDDDGFLISCSSCTCPVTFTASGLHREDGLPFSASLAAACLELFVHAVPESQSVPGVIARSSSTSPNRAPPRAIVGVSQHSLSQNVFFCAHVDPMSTQCRLNVEGAPKKSHIGSS